MNENLQLQHTVLERALLLVRAGYAIIPVGRMPGDKSPLLMSWLKYMPVQRNGEPGVIPTELEVIEWWNRWPQAKLAIIGGWQNLCVIDVDDLTIAADLIEKFKTFAPLVRTPSGGLHIYVREEERSRSGPLIEGKVDIKAEGGYWITPPSEGYEKLNAVQEPLGIPCSVRDYAADYLASYNLDAKTKLAVTANGEEITQLTAGRRNHTLTSFAGTLRRRKLGEAAIAAALKGINEVLCDPPLSEKEVAAVAHSIARYPIEDAWVREVKPLKSLRKEAS